MSEEHPSYPNPTIHEALCEIHFQLPDGVSWQPSLPGELFKRIQSEFPKLEPATQIGFRLQVGPGEVEQAFFPPQQRMRYRHESRNLLLQLSEGIFTVNELEKYPGWEQMRSDILRYWETAREVTEPGAVTRIGLRYINRIQRTLPDERAGDWLAPSDFVAGSALSSLPGFLSRVQTRLDPQRRLIVTVTDTFDAVGQDTQPIVLDIDCIVQKQIGVQHGDIAREIDELHNLVWRVFRASKTPRLERFLKGEVEV